MKLDHIALDRLSISPANMRSGKKPPDISGILPSIRARGIIMPLLVRPNGSDTTFEIVAGSRRFLAAQTVANENGVAEPLPCAIMEAGDDAAALEASLIENLARLAPDEVTQWESFTRLVKEGRTPDEISMTFGMPELTVKRILALGNLLPRIRQLYRAEEIDATSVRHLTLATKAQQKTWLALYDDPQSSIPKGHQLKAWLFGGASISTSVALFDLETYHGRIVKDLFEKDGYFGDLREFEDAQRAAIEERKAAYIADGWSDVVVLPDGQYFHRYEFAATPKRKGGRVYVTIAHNGEVAFHEGYLTEREAKRIAKGEAPDATTKASRPEITAAMTSYIDLHRHAAVRSALAANTGVALRVMVAHAICGSPLWGVRVQDQRSRNEAITESIETSVAEARFDERRRAVLGVLGFDPDEPSVTLGHEPRNGVSGLFQRLLELPDAVVMEVLGVVMAETLASGTGLIETIGLHLGVKMADYWVADDAFYGLVRDREVLTEVLREVGGDTVAQAHATEKGKTIKSVINDYLTGSNDRIKVEQWVPRWMAFPPSAYTQRGGVATVAAASRAAWLAEPEVPLDPDPAAVAAEAVEGGDADEAEAIEDMDEQRLAA
ncbi:MAG: ParB/RepB/Spo0J family partition protein [Sphingobium sp.]|jgi:ParB family chromosome partitioning protein|nr:ParB/RepB/Spo0J family partition protein [Sphingobium sp.]MCI1270278.1 ParB/RepB/Spo0J family partition protein [Sphingobium sp.]MCI1754545.1 ParB/RepB/Spo0J family partition protein [Sphingobium sp.]MCI2051984.1 ParB/RepB/Spo0J family partition protein [Sphingobium sp.]